MKVRVYLDIPHITLDLSPEQIEALRDEYSWEPFYDTIADELLTHAENYLSIEDVIVLE